MGVSKTFDFQPVVEGLYGVAGLKPFTAMRQAVPLFLPIPVVRQYMAGFFQDNFLIHMNEVMEQPGLQPPANGYLNNNYKDFRQAAQAIHDGRFSRNKDVYPLTIEETAHAIEVYSRTPLLQQTVAGFQAVLVEYFRDLQWYHETECGHLPSDVYASVQEQLEKTTATRILFFFLHDLMPVIASSIENPHAPELTEDVFRHGLATAFGKSCFASVDPGNGALTQCPFSSIIGHLFNTVLAYGDDGCLHVKQEERPGALPAFIARRIQILQAEREAVLIPKAAYA